MIRCCNGNIPAEHCGMAKVLFGSDPYAGPTLCNRHDFTRRDDLKLIYADLVQLRFIGVAFKILQAFFPHNLVVKVSCFDGLGILIDKILSGPGTDDREGICQLNFLSHIARELIRIPNLNEALRGSAASFESALAN